MAKAPAAPKASIDPSAKIQADRLRIGEGTKIEADVQINGRDVRIGRNVTISEGTTLGGFRFRPLKRLVLGDDVFLGPRVQLSVPSAVIGDYAKVHRHCSLYGQEPLVLGHNAWCGENSILNSSGGLYVGNNVGIATRNSIWTHIAHADLIEGSRFRSFTPTVVSHNAWFLPDVTISSGVIVGEGSVVFPNSVVTKDTAPRHLYAGTPAEDITAKVPPYEAITPEEKILRLESFLKDYAKDHRLTAKRVVREAMKTWAFSNGTFVAVMQKPRSDTSKAGLPDGALVFSYGFRDRNRKTTSFDLKAKTYTKRYTEAERSLISYLGSGLARFVPADRPVLEPAFLKQCLAAIRRSRSKK